MELILDSGIKTIILSKNTVEYTNPKVLRSTMGSIFHTDIIEIKENLIKQLTSPVRWTQSVENMVADGATDFIESGPGKVLQGLVKKIHREANVQAI